MNLKEQEKLKQILRDEYADFDRNEWHYDREKMLIGKAYTNGRAYLTDITHRNYEATKRRGLIADNTLFTDFIEKMREEVDELAESYNIGRLSCEFDPKELADKALVCFAMAEHFGIDLIEEMRKKTEFNEKRS